MTYEYHIIAKNKLPKGFKYPKSYLHYLKYNETQEEVREYGCWEERYMIRGGENGYSDADFFYNQIMHEYPDETLIPFARLYDDELFCFDGNDTSGDPAIYLVSVFSSEYERIEKPERVNENFYDWLENSLQNSAEACIYKNIIYTYNDLYSHISFPTEYIDKVKIWDIYRVPELYNTRFSFLAQHDDDTIIIKRYSDKNLLPFMTYMDSSANIKYVCVFEFSRNNDCPKIYILETENKTIVKDYLDFPTFWNNLISLDQEFKKNHEK